MEEIQEEETKTSTWVWVWLFSYALVIMSLLIGFLPALLIIALAAIMFRVRAVGKKEGTWHTKQAITTYLLYLILVVVVIANKETLNHVMSLSIWGYSLPFH